MGQSLWVRDAAEYEPEGDHIICRWEDNEWIMSPAIAQTTVARISEALAKWQFAALDGNVTRIGRKRK